MICPNCGTSNRDAARFCAGCGAGLPQAPAGSWQGGYEPPAPQQGGGYPPQFAPISPAQAGWSPDPGFAGREPAGRCPQCGQQNVPAATYCVRCGAALAPAAGYLPANAAMAPGPGRGAAGGQAARRSSRGWIIAAVVGLVVLALVAAGWVFGREWLRMGTSETAQLMPSDPDAYVVVSPSADQLARLTSSNDAELLGFPLIQLDLIQPNEYAAILDMVDVDFDRDIRPWMGLEAAAAVYGLEDRATTLVMAVATRDQELSDEFLRNVQDAMEDQGAEFDETTYRGVPITFEVDGSRDGASFATINRFVVVATTLDKMKEVVDASQERAARLAEDAGYLDLESRLPAGRIGAVYLSELVKVIADDISAGWLPATNAVAIALQMEDDGLRLEVVQEIDTRDLDGDALAAIQRNAAGDRLAGLLPQDTLAVAMGSDFARTWRQVALDVPGFLNEDLDLTLQYFREGYGVDLEDVFDPLAGDYAIAVLDNAGRSMDWPRPAGLAFLLAFDVPAGEQEAIDETMQDALDELERSLGGSAQSRTSGDLRVHALADTAGNKIAGYTLAGDALLVAIGESAVDALVEQEAAPLADEDLYRQSMAALPGAAESVLYVDADRSLRTLKRGTGLVGAGTVEESIEPALQSLLALSAASLPVDEDGYQNTVIYLLTADARR